MKLFPWLPSTRQKINTEQNTHPSAEEWQQALSPSALLTQSVYQPKLHELKQLVSVTPHYYQVLYVKLLEAIAGAVQQLPHPYHTHYQIKNGFLLAALDYALSALKYRRGYMLPLGADTETCYREQDAWTYAIFTAALLQECWLLLGAFQIAVKESPQQEAYLWNPLLTSSVKANGYYRFKVTPVMAWWRSANPVLVKQLLPENALAWLSRYPDLFNAWWKSIARIEQADNPMQTILQKAHQHLFIAALKEERNENKISAEMKAEESVALVTTLKAPESVVPSAQPLETTSVILTELTAIKQTAHATPVAAEATKPFLLTELLIATIKQQFKQIQASINQPHGFIHRVHEGILLIIPTIWDWLLLHCPALKSTWTVHKGENLYNTLLQALLEENRLIKNSTQNSLLHRYFIGRWEARQVLAGIVVPVEDLFAADHLPAINEQLHLEPAL